MRVLHILTRLNRSGMERMLECSHDLWVAAGVEPIILGMSDGDHPYAPALQARGYQVVESQAVRSVRGLNGLRRSVRAIRPDIVHIHQESCFDAVAVISKLSRGVEGLVYTVHDSFPFEGNLRARRSAARRQADGLDSRGLLAQSRSRKTNDRALVIPPSWSRTGSTSRRSRRVQPTKQANWCARRSACRQNLRYWDSSGIAAWQRITSLFPRR